jgi:hypothetical protein
MGNLVPLGGCLKAIEERAWLSRNTRTGLKETKGGREKQGMFSSGRDVLYETWCRNADLIFQNASTTALPPRVVRDTDAPGDGSAGDTPSQAPAAHSGCGGGTGGEGTLSRGSYERAGKRAGKYQLTGSARHPDCNYCSSGTVAFRPTVSACHARQGSKAHRYRAERAPHRPCGARERDGSGIREHCAGQQKKKGKGDQENKSER